MLKHPPPPSAIHVCHVGSRNGWSRNPLDALRTDLYFTLFDADAECVEHDKKNFSSSTIDPSRYRFLNVGLAGKSETRTLHLNKDGNTSSLLQYNNRFDNLIITNQSYNYDIRKACTEIKTVSIGCKSADEVFQDEHSPPDFLTLDTQGTEHEILQGAENLLKNSILGVLVEVGFVELYKKQKLFHDIMQTLISHGFRYVGLESFSTCYQRHSLDKIRGKGFAFVGDALFLKDFTKILNSDRHVDKRKVLKLAAMAIVFELYDYAYEILDALNTLSQCNTWTKENQNCYTFLCQEFYDAYKQQMQAHFSRQKYYYSYEEFTNTVIRTNQHSRETTQKNWHATVLLKKITNQSLRRTAIRTIRKSHPILASIHYAISPTDQIEKILKKYGFAEQARRQKQARAAITVAQLIHRVAPIVI